MILTEQQQAMLDGSRGEVVSKVMRTLVLYGEAFGAERMAPVTGKHGHVVTSFGLSVMKGVFHLMDELNAAGVASGQTFSADPRPLDPHVPASLPQRLVFRAMYGAQGRYEAQLEKAGLMDRAAFTCACYLDEVGNTPEKGEILSWAESSAVSYANSVLGARCNRNSGIIELFGSIAGCVPYFGLLTDEGRRADWIVEVRTAQRPEAQLLGSAVGRKVMEGVPYLRGLDRFLGSALDEEARAYLKDFGAAAASNGAVGLYHAEHLTPEAVESGEALVKPGAQTYVIDDAELARVRSGYPVVWKDPDAKPKLCFVGCPHLSFAQLGGWTERLGRALAGRGRKKVAVPTVFTAPPAVLERFGRTEQAAKLRQTGVVVSSICPLMYMNNPLCGKMPVITNSNKLRTYTSARYYTDGEILTIITGGELQ